MTAQKMDLTDEHAKLKETSSKLMKEQFNEKYGNFMSKNGFDQKEHEYYFNEIYMKKNGQAQKMLDRMKDMKRGRESDSNDTSSSENNKRQKMSSVNNENTSVGDKLLQNSKGVTDGVMGMSIKDSDSMETSEQAVTTNIEASRTVNNYFKKNYSGDVGSYMKMFEQLVTAQRKGVSSNDKKYNIEYDEYHDKQN